MTHYPDAATFEALSERFDLIPVYRRLYSDTMTPVTAFHRLDDGRQRLFVRECHRGRESRAL